MGHKDWILSVSISPDGRLVASGGRDNVIKIWDLYLQDEVLTLTGHSDWVGSVIFSPDGKYLLSGSWDRTIRLWDVKTGIEIKRFSENADGITCVSFSPDGKYFLSTANGVIKLWDLFKGDVVKLFLGHMGLVQSASFSPDGKYIVSGGFDGMVKLWDVESGEELNTFIGHINFVHSVSISPDGKYIASGGWDKTVKIWNLNTGKWIKSFRGHSGWVLSTSFSQDGNYIISAGTDKSIIVWNIGTGEKIIKLQAHNNWISSLALSKDGKFFVSGSCDRTINVWDTIRGNRLLTLGKQTKYTAVAISKDGNYAASSDLNNSINLWDMRSGRKIRSFSKNYHPITALSFSPDGKYLLSGNYEKHIKVWDTQSGTIVKILPGHLNGTTSITFSRSGKYLLTSGLDKNAILWDWETGKILQYYYGHSNKVTSSAFSPDEKYIATCDLDGIINVWDINLNQNIFSKKAHSAGVYNIAFSPTGRYLASGGLDNIVKLWDFINNKEIMAYKGHKGFITAVAFSIEEDKIISTSMDKTIKIWDTFSGRLIKNIESPTDELASLAISKNQFITANLNGVLTLWNVDKDSEIARFYSLRNKEWLVITPSGYYNSSSMGDIFFNINIGKEIYTLDQFRNTFYRPDIVKKVLKEGGLTNQTGYLSIEKIEKIKPPEIYTDFSKNPAVIGFKDENTGLKSIKIYQNGILIYKYSSNPGEIINNPHKSNNCEGSFIIPEGLKCFEDKISFNLKECENLIEILASNGFSESKKVVLLNPTNLIKNVTNNLWLISIGIGKYNDSLLPKLSFSSKDAIAIAKMFKNLEGKSFKNVNSITITNATNKKPTYEEIIGTIKDIKINIKENDTFILYLSGIGLSDNRDNIYLLTSDAVIEENFPREAKGWINLEALIKEMDFPAKKIILADLYQPNNNVLKVFDYEKLIGIGKDYNLAIFTSSKDVEAPLESEKLGHSIFTYAIIEGIIKKCNQDNTSVSLSDLQFFLLYQIPKLSDYLQNPGIYVPVSYKKTVLSEER